MVHAIKHFALVIAAAAFLLGCGNNAVQQQPPQVATQPQQENLTDEPLPGEDDYWAKDNFDLQRVGRDPAVRAVEPSPRLER